MVWYEWRNDLLAVSSVDQVKLKCPWRCGLRVVGQWDPVHLC